jgi:hypothetical protein
MVLAEIVENFVNLEWVPQPSLDDRRPRQNQIIENPIRHLNVIRSTSLLPLAPTRAIQQLMREGEEQHVSVVSVVSVWTEYINRWRSLQNLYKDCGWGTEGYDGEELERRRGELFERLEVLEKQGHDARRNAQAQRGDVGTARESIKTARQSFWAENAGANAM